MNDHSYEMTLTLNFMGCEEDKPEPHDYVVDAVKTILRENWDEWLAEAAGHPNCERFTIEG